MATLPKLPECPKCGKVPEFYRTQYLGGDDEDCIEGIMIVLMCHCKKFKTLCPFDSYLAPADRRIPIMDRVHRATMGMRIQWKEYVKESNNGSCSEDKN